MTLSAGRRLGPYDVLAPLGSGGMGEVWRARDTTLGRDVALKILPDAFAADPDRLSRFEREALVLASLNHPNIAAIYGVQASDDVRALVLELVDGPTLADRIARGPLPLEEALPIASQIAEALEAAHARGIVHRDLKPANVKVRPDGLVKVLDFGLAKALDTAPSGPDASVSPTMTSPAMTRMGVIMGTAAYMSPEQARGADLDARTDIWSFGVVLYEMLTGKALFDGPTVSDTLAAVLRADLDWNRLLSTGPAPVRSLLNRCLQRDARRRWQHAGDVRIEIEELHARPLVDARVPPPRQWRLAVMTALLAGAIVGPMAWLFKPAESVPVAPTSFVIRTPSEAPISRVSPLALSPDGRSLVYGIGLDIGLSLGNRLIHQRLDSFDPRPLDTMGSAGMPFFSPDGSAVAFYAGTAGELRQLPLAGGAATRLVDSVRDNLGASWGDDGIVVFSADWGQPLQVARPGAKTRGLTELDIAGGERAHLWPQILPGNRAVLFTIWTGAPTWDEERLAVADLETGKHTVVLRGGTSGRYAASGHLVFWRGNALMAAPFDLDRLTVTGEAVRVVQDVRLTNSNGGAHFALSETGTLAYVAGGNDTFAESAIVERSGRQVARLDEALSVGDPAYSPDGRHVALTLYRGGTYGVGVFDLGRHLLTPLPLEGDSLRPIWTPKGDRVTFISNAGGAYEYYSMPFDGSGAPEPLFARDRAAPSASNSLARTAWSPDGRTFLYVRPGEKTGADIWIHTSGGQPMPLVATPANESNPAFSPDGRFLAYQSDESGTIEIYVRPFPNVASGRNLISRSGGTAPAWARNGTEIFYRAEQGIMRVAVTPGRGDAAPSFGQPSLALAVAGLTSFDVSPDGRTFAIERVPVEKAAKEIRVVVNWFEDLKRLVPPR